MNFSQSCKFDSKSLNRFVRKYSPLHLHHELAEQLERFFPDENLFSCSKYQLHIQLNNLVLADYSGEAVLKYSLFTEFKLKDNVGAFEVRVGRSRADFLSINGSSSSFEIKSSLDTLQKLAKQAADYVKAFDFNYIVIDEKHLFKAIDLIPTSFGIWSFSKGCHKQHRQATPNDSIDPEMQLKLLTKREKRLGFKEVLGDENSIVKEYSPFDINTRFKQVMKWRYKSRWNFLVTHAHTILPIDLQFFFNKNVLPEIIYNQDSSYRSDQH